MWGALCDLDCVHRGRYAQGVRDPSLEGPRPVWGPKTYPSPYRLLKRVTAPGGEATVPAAQAAGSLLGGLQLEPAGG